MERKTIRKRKTLNDATSSKRPAKFDKDDEIINKMEKKLKLKRRKNGKLPQNFYEEGLGDILDVIDGRVNAEELSDDEPTFDFKEFRERRMKQESRCETPEPDTNSDLEAIDDNEEPDSDDRGTSELGSEEEVFEGEILEKSDSEAEYSGSNSDDDGKNNKLVEDIYGFVRDKKGNIIKDENQKVILPDKELNEQVVRRIRGLLNRITASNLPYVSSQIQDIFKTHSLYEVCHSLFKCINDLIVRDICLTPQKLISEVSMLVAVLHTHIGDEVGGHILHSLVKALNETLNSTTQQLESKKMDNIIALISNIYACNVVSSILVFDILKKLCEIFDEKCVELIIQVLRSVGFVLRKDNPLQMKELILIVREKASNSASESKRVTFMLETLTAVRNNNILKITADNSGVTAIDTQLLKSTMKNCLKDHTSVSCVHGGYKEILESNRWWIKTGDLLELRKDEKESDEQKIQISADKLNINEKLCRKLRLNTPLRKVLFNALITSNDYIDASQRLLSIARKQAVEIVNVVLHVALHQKEFNQFYTHLLRHLSDFDRKFKVAVFYAIKDRISEIASFSTPQRQNLSKITFELMKLTVITINVLKVIEFSDMNDTYADFLKFVLSSILNEEPEVMQQIFSKIPKKDTFATAIRLFISCFIDSEFKMNLS